MNVLCARLFVRRSALYRNLCTQSQSAGSDQSAHSSHQSVSEQSQSSTNEQAAHRLSADQSLTHLYADTDRFREDIYVELHADMLEAMQHSEYMSHIMHSELEYDEVDDDEWTQAREHYHRDTSGLRPLHQWQVHGIVPPMDKWAWQWERDNLRERYAQFGRASAVNPGLHWMTQEELNEQKQLDEHYNPPLDKVLKQVKKTKNRETKLRDNRLKEVEKRLQSYEEKVAVWQKETAETEAKEAATKAEAAQRLQEIKDEFGYYIDVNDKQFKKVFEEKEKLAKKLAKKEAAEKKRLEEAEALL